jgi:hypothetical protein
MLWEGAVTTIGCIWPTGEHKPSPVKQTLKTSTRTIYFSSRHIYENKSGARETLMHNSLFHEVGYLKRSPKHMFNLIINLSFLNIQHAIARRYTHRWVTTENKKA